MWGCQLGETEKKPFYVHQPPSEAVSRWCPSAQAVTPSKSQSEGHAVAFWALSSRPVVLRIGGAMEPLRTRQPVIAKHLPQRRFLDLACRRVGEGINEGHIIR